MEFNKIFAAVGVALAMEAGCGDSDIDSSDLNQREVGCPDNFDAGISPVTAYGDGFSADIGNVMDKDAFSGLISGALDLEGECDGTGITDCMDIGSDASEGSGD